MKPLVVTLTIAVCVAQALNLMPERATIGNTPGEMEKYTEEHVKNITRRSQTPRNATSVALITQIMANVVESNNNTRAPVKGGSTNIGDIYRQLGWPKQVQ